MKNGRGNRWGEKGKASHNRGEGDKEVKGGKTAAGGGGFSKKKKGPGTKRRKKDGGSKSLRPDERARGEETEKSVNSKG